MNPAFGARRLINGVVSTRAPSEAARRPSGRRRHHSTSALYKSVEHRSSPMLYICAACPLHMALFFQGFGESRDVRLPSGPDALDLGECFVPVPLKMYS